jgi:hypothetical protein
MVIPKKTSVPGAPLNGPSANSILGYNNSTQRLAMNDVAVAAQTGVVARYQEIDKAMGDTIREAAATSASVCCQIPNRSFDASTVRFYRSHQEVISGRSGRVLEGMTWLDNLPLRRSRSFA